MLRLWQTGFQPRLNSRSVFSGHVIVNLSERSIAADPDAVDLFLAEALTPDSVSQWLDDSVKGLICEVDDKPVGFAMGDCRSGEVLVIAIYPQFEKKGIGGELMIRLQNRLWLFGPKELWLWSNPDKSVRACGFYRALGWRPTGEIRGNNEKLTLSPNVA